MGGTRDATRGQNGRTVARLGAVLMVIGVGLVLSTVPMVLFDVRAGSFGRPIGPLEFGVGVLAAGVMLALWADARAWAQRIR